MLLLLMTRAGLMPRTPILAARRIPAASVVPIRPSTKERLATSARSSNCTILENVKKDVMPTAGCHHLAADRDRQACEALYCCMRTHRCVVNGDPTPCWCGTADPNRCANGADVANGPCLAETQAAAGTIAAVGDRR